MKREIPVYEAHTLMDPSDLLKYSGTTAMIVHTQTTDELKFRLRMAMLNFQMIIKISFIFLLGKI
jgi:hypothetical protein